MKIVRPDSSIICEKENYINRENAGGIKINCADCRDKNKCLNESAN